eukprot:80010_1
MGQQLTKQSSQANIETEINQVLKSSVNCSNTKQASKDCSCWQRIGVGLKQYHLLCDVMPNNQDNFIYFCNEQYTNFLDDYIHVIKKHQNDLLIVSDELKHKYGVKACDIQTCTKLHSHFDREYENYMKNVTKEYRFYSQCYDQCHFYLFHLYDMGYRIEPTIINNDENNTTYDTVFATTRDLLQNRVDHLTNVLNIQRYRQENNKYNIQLTIDENKTKDQVEEITFIEQIYNSIETNKDKIDANMIKSLRNFINDNEYDTDAVLNDLDDLKAGSNTLNYIKNESCIDLMTTYIRNLNLSATSFSTGYIFYYWTHCKQQTNKSLGDRLNGYSVAELYVPQHYSSLKIEILQSSFLGAAQWQENIVLKADKYNDTEEVKQMTCNGEQKHDISAGEHISKQHLYSIILYCDWSKLCSEFSGTFRKRTSFESLRSLKSRHSKYYWFGKLLVETVNDFGTIGLKERGPFYCGMSIVLNIPSFAIYLKGPCSTSKEMAVSLNFAKRDGIVIQLQNDSGNGSRQRFLDCSFVSNYVEEAEMLFIAGDYRLRIESIRIIETAQNFQKFFCSFYLFDCMISGVRNYEFKISSSDKKILSR